jgi:parvulin-like peptidyl-prolyl isomerase
MPAAARELLWRPRLPMKTLPRCALIILLIRAAALPATGGPPAIVEEIIARVNGDIITRGDLDKALARKETAPADALKTEIDQLLLIQKAKERNVNVEADLTREIAALQSQSKLADPEKFHEWVRAMSGLSYEDFRQANQNLLLTERVIGEEVWRNIVIPDADIQAYYDDHKTAFVRTESVTLRLILISTGDGKPDTVAAAQKKAASLLARARGTADRFSDLARQFSDDPSVADDGLLPPFTRNTLNKDVEDVVFRHEKGYITDVIRVRVGFEIFRVEEHIPDGQASLDDVKAQINNILIRPLADPKLRDYLTTLRRNAFLQIKPGYIDSGAAPDKDTTWSTPSQLMPETITKAAVANQRHLRRIFGLLPGR